jgi:hypothetical protein
MMLRLDGAARFAAHTSITKMSGMDPAMKQRMAGIDLTKPETRDAVYQLHGYYKEKKAAEAKVAADSLKDKPEETASARVAYKQEFGKIFNTGKLAGRRATRCRALT